MKKKFMVTADSCLKMKQWFTDTQEIVDFFSLLLELSKEQIVSSISLMTGEVSERELILKNISTFALFCCDNMEIIQQLARSIEVVEITEEEAERIKKESKKASS